MEVAEKSMVPEEPEEPNGPEEPEEPEAQEVEEAQEVAGVTREVPGIESVQGLMADGFLL